MYNQLTDIKITDQEEFFRIFLAIIKYIKSAHKQGYAFVNLSPDVLYYDSKEEELISVGDSPRLVIGNKVPNEYGTDNLENLGKSRETNPFTAPEAFFCKVKWLLGYTEDSYKPSVIAETTTVPPDVQASMDVYSLGAITYKLLNNNLNFTEKKEEEEFKKSSKLYDILRRCGLKNRPSLSEVERIVTQLQKKLKPREKSTRTEATSDLHQALTGLRDELRKNRNLKESQLKHVVTQFDKIFLELKNAKTAEEAELAKMKFETASKSLFFQHGDKGSNVQKDNPETETKPKQ